MVGGQPVGQQPAERVAAHHDPVELERVEEPDHVAGVILHRVAGRRGIALAAAAQVEREHVRDVPEPRAHEPVE